MHAKGSRPQLQLTQFTPNASFLLDFIAFKGQVWPIVAIAPRPRSLIADIFSGRWDQMVGSREGKGRRGRWSLCLYLYLFWVHLFKDIFCAAFAIIIIFVFLLFKLQPC